MITVDALLIHLFKNAFLTEKVFPSKDKRILLSLARQLLQNTFLTENQSKLLTKIFKENAVHLDGIVDDVLNVINSDTWSEPFRVIQKIRKIYIDPSDADTLVIEFTYDKRLRNKLTGLNNRLQGSLSTHGTRHFSVSLTEKNIHILVGEFLRENFEIDEKIMKFYEDIDRTLSSSEINFSILDSKNENLKKILTEDIGTYTSENHLLLNDRKIRYQYEFFEKLPDKSLTTLIAQRPSTKIFIDNSSCTLTEVIASLKNLNRLPLLVIFDGHDSTVNKKSLNLLADALKANGVDDHIGIYFRFNQGNDPAGFNKTISELGYNKNLSEHSQVAGIANSKLPKFFIKDKWKPKSVISFTTSFKNSKSYVYCTDVDLIIYYGDKKPIQGNVDVIM
jgi:hypothetical protein